MDALPDIFETTTCSVMIQLAFTTEHDILVQRVFRILADIAALSMDRRNQIVQMNIQPIVEKAMAASNPSIEYVRAVAFFCAQVTHGTPVPPIQNVLAMISYTSNLLVTLGEELDTHALVDCCRTISNVLYTADAGAIQVIAAYPGLVKTLCLLLTMPNYTITEYVLQALGNMACGNDDLVLMIIDANGLVHLRNHLNSPKKVIVKNTCWVLSNMATGHQESFLGAGLIPLLVHKLTSAEHDTRKEAAFALCNFITKATVHQIDHICSTNRFFQPLCELLNHADTNLIFVVLCALDAILHAGKVLQGAAQVNKYAIELEEVGGLDKIENLQTHVSEQIYEKVLHILETYFSCEEEVPY